ncbi:heme exporter protein CcmD [Sphingomonas sp. Root710]|nr:heme exporter protein CcmD [Sphingomonas sp. Root710]
MNHWPFIIAAYAISMIGTIGVVAVSFAAMRRAEKQADALTRRD